MKLAGLLAFAGFVHGFPQRLRTEQYTGKTLAWKSLTSRRFVNSQAAVLVQTLDCHGLRIAGSDQLAPPELARAWAATNSA